MYLNDNLNSSALPLYEVKELTMEEAMLVIAAEKEAVCDSSAGQSDSDWGGVVSRVETAVG